LRKVEKEVRESENGTEGARRVCKSRIYNGKV
jgi:hypothetical protein